MQVDEYCSEQSLNMAESIVLLRTYEAKGGQTYFVLPAGAIKNTLLPIINSP